MKRNMGRSSMKKIRKGLKAAGKQVKKAKRTQMKTMQRHTYGGKKCKKCGKMHKYKM